jgi:hypothetical protein
MLTIPLLISQAGVNQLLRHSVCARKLATGSQWLIRAC